MGVPLTHIDRETWFVRDILPHEGVLRSYLGRFFAQSSDVDDVLQEAYARLIGLTDEERASVRSFPSFLFVTARNVALDRLRRQRIVSLETVAELDDLDVMDESPAAWEQINAHQELAMLGKALAALPDRCRQVLTLRKVFGLSQKEIAARLSITENTVEKQISNGMRLCATHLYALMDNQSTIVGSGVPKSRSRGRTDVE